MGIQDSLDVLSELVERYESAGRSVRNVEARAASEGDGSLQATLTVPVSLSTSGNDRQANLEPTAASVTDRGTVQVEFAVEDLLERPAATDAAIEVSERAVQATAADGLLLTVELTIRASEDTDPTAAPRADADGAAGTDPAASSAQEPATGDSTPAETDPLASVRDESVPPYDDTPYLRRLYESCGTFAEMSRKIEMDVSSETVRRYMIEAGIHDPNSYDTAAGEGPAAARPDEQDTERPGAGETTETPSDDEDDSDSSAGDETAGSDASSTDGPDAEDEPDPIESPAATVDPRESLSEEQILTDGIGLPPDIALEDVADAVVEATTLYEVQQRLGIGQDRTRELLRQLNLLDLVLHRVSSPPTRPPSYEMVAARIDQCTAEKA